MGCVGSTPVPPQTSRVAEAASGTLRQRLDKLSDGSDAVVDAERARRLDPSIGSARRVSTQDEDKCGSITQNALLSMAMEADVKEEMPNEVVAGRPREFSLAASRHDDHAEEINKIPDVQYSIRETTADASGSDGTSSAGGLSAHSGLSKNVVTNRPAMRNLQPGGINPEFADHHGGHVFALPIQPFNAGGPRGMPFVSMQGATPLGTPGLPMSMIHGRPPVVYHLAPLEASYVSEMGRDTAPGLPLHDLGGFPARFAIGRGRGRGSGSGPQTVVVGPAATIGPGTFRGPVQVPRIPGHVPMGMGRGRGQPLQIAIPGGQTTQHGEAGSQHQQTAAPIHRTVRPLSAASDDDDDDNDDLVDDDEVEDWGLDTTDDDGADKVSSSILAEQEKGTPTNVLPPNSPETKLQSTALGTAIVAKQKFRPAFELADDGIEIVAAGSEQNADSDDDDDDDTSDVVNDELQDWLDTTREPGTLLLKSSQNAPSAQSMVRQPDAPPRMVSGSTTPQDNPTKSSPAPPPTSPLSRQGMQMPTGSPHPPLPSQQASLRQLHGLVGTGHTSPTRPAGPPPPGGSPVKPPSYRSNIVTNAMPPLVPLLNAGASPLAGAGERTAAGIRDTKVVKKKKAELPHTNLPHPAPKFGDWLNSRTMINNYIILESLGAGSYAEVKLCKEKVTGKLFAMKFINRDIMKKDRLGKQSKLDDIKREIAIMKKLSHPNVLRLYEVMDDPSMNKLFLVLEYMKYGDLLSHQKKKNPSGGNLHDRDLHCVTLQVILGLAYLHEQKIVHGDIKPQNLLVGDKDVVKIADFGISQSLYGSKQKLSDTAGTPAFMSPEMCSGQEYSGQLADIWAVGATVFMLKFGQPPFVAKSAMQMFERIQNDPLVFPGPIDPLLEDLLRGMMTKNPLKRTTLLQVMTHQWVTKEEHPSHFALKDKSPQITVTNEEIYHAVDAGDKFAIVVNMRVQMMKRLQMARTEILTKRQSAGLEESHTAAHQMLISSIAHADDSTLAASNTEKMLTKGAMKPKTKSNRVFVDAGGVSERSVVTGDIAQKKILSKEETHYRSQLFTRKKASGVAGANGASSATFPKVGEHDGYQLTDLEGASAGLGGVDDDDEDVFSDDEEDDLDDEHAVSQSPQLLDELLLTTLSIPPLTKSIPPPRTSAAATTLSNSATTSMLPALSTATAAPNHAPDGQSFYGENHHLNLSIAVASLQGRRNTQEDRWTVVTDIETEMSSRWSQSLFAGLYDGHGGEECANILQEQLHTWLFRAPDEYFTPVKLERCFLEFDSFLCDFLLQKGDLSGSTATCVFVDHASSQPACGVWTLLVGHVGDCRLVLTSRHGGSSAVHELTKDHRLTLATERERVLQLGGRVVNNRVNGVMAITRAFGDLEFKARLRNSSGATSSSSAILLPQAVQQNPFQRDDEPTAALLTARPDIHWCRVDARDHEFLLLACDGLWDVMTSDEAADILRDRVHFHGDLSLAAKELAQEAIRRFSNDNISVLVIHFPLDSGAGNLNSGVN